MRIDDIIKVSNDMEMNENKNFIKSVLSVLKNMAYREMTRFLRNKTKEFFDALDKSGISKQKVIDVVNRRLDVSVSPNYLLKHKVVNESKLIKEGWWKEASSNIYGSLSFYPILTVFLELDKIVKGSADADMRAMATYFILWVLIITGKVGSDKLKGSKDNKDVVKQGA